MKHFNTIAIALSIVLAALLLGRAYTYKYRAQETVVVTGLAEREFTSDLIVWRGWITAEARDAAEGYKQIEQSKEKVLQFITSHGIAADSVVFMFVNVNKEYEGIYSSNGNYMGQQFKGYSLRQSFTVESTNVDAVEAISREISSLIAQGVSLESWQPEYYYTRLDDVKHDLIERATADARGRAEKIATASGARLGKVSEARMGVFQITGANTNDEFTAGGSFNTSSRHKKARITMKLEYRVK
ncbi:MAG: SIMPL domain-containing protein [Rikenellaceae bacterium]|nr:SIMPL domain-containing protein [Rikenellaceae bacterium]MBQ5852507.1 SIMPL domain-containing protein [Rikenellaceae bacterium]